MNRRGFLGSILALGAAPAIVRADSLMQIVPRNTTVYGIATQAAWKIHEGNISKTLWPGVRAWWYAVDYSNGFDEAIGVLTAQQKDGSILIVKDYKFKDLKCHDV